ncbi:transglutaminase family protein [Bryobacter aggregatus]|uniref:transglutaminase family protein n=1 Tax=Bryobacter aggregatus TaxID=360054 RepID=UPI0004E236AE|nr:transglutaminase family protein [Bryobacter aggregatus]
MLYRAIHTTSYSYEGPVSHCLSEARLTPRILPNQQLRDWNLTVSPAPRAILSRKDYFGNDVSSFAVLEPHNKFIVSAESLVEVLPRESTLGFSPRWDDMLQANAFIWPSPYVPWLEDLAEYAKPALQQGHSLASSAEALMRQIYRDFAYEPKATAIETPLAEVLEKRQGVCQDYAHVMIGALRAHRIAARYVSGYLRGDAEFQGAQASHAWVSVFVPEQGWIDFDPTNNVLPGTGHLTIAWGRDYGDVTPVKGITIGGGEHTLEVDVRVTPA